MQSAKFWLFILLLSATAHCRADVSDDIRKGALAEKQGDYDQAIELFSRALNEGVSSEQAATLHLYRGACFFSKGSFDEAIADLDVALRLNPNDKMALNDRGNAYNRLGQYHSAISDYSEALKLDPRYASAYVDRSVAYMNLGLLEKSKADLDQALNLDSNNTHALDDRGRLYVKMHVYEQALTDFNQMVTISPDKAEGYADRARLLFVMSRFSDATADFTEALKLSPEHLYNPLWRFLAELRLKKDGKQQLRDATSASSSNGWPHAVAKFFLGQSTRQELLDAAKDQDIKKEAAQLCDAYTYLGEYELAEPNRDSAKHLFSKAALVCQPSDWAFDVVSAELIKLR